MRPAVAQPFDFLTHFFACDAADFGLEDLTDVRHSNILVQNFGAMLSEKSYRGVFGIRSVVANGYARRSSMPRCQFDCGR